MQAIKTKYRGILFRSGLEARWAKFFDTLGIQWVYEPEGYQLSDGLYYLPDFYLPEQDQFFEVKGVMTDIDMNKIEKLAKESHKSVVIGRPDGCMEIADVFNAPYIPYDYEKSQTAVYKCRTCGKWWFLNDLYSWKCRCCGEYDGDGHIAEWHDNDDIQKIFQSIQIKVGKWD